MCVFMCIISDSLQNVKCKTCNGKHKLVLPTMLCRTEDIIMACSGLVAKPCLTLVTPWTVACQAPLSMGILQARILEWVTMLSSGGSCQPRD